METKIIQDKIEQLEKEINELKQQLLNIPIDDTVNVNSLYNGFFNKKVKKTNNKSNKIKKPDLYKMYIKWCDDNSYVKDRMYNFYSNVFKIFGPHTKTNGLHYIPYIKEQ
jgi:regulator of replication initiation timing